VEHIRVRFPYGYLTPLSTTFQLMASFIWN
jgi:hypothetical protein